jgi:hypothetical protein
MVCELPVLDPPAACLQFEMEEKKKKKKKLTTAIESCGSQLNWWIYDIISTKKMIKLKARKQEQKRYA